MTTATQAQPPTLTTKLLTADEYVELPDDGRYTELIRGRIVDVPRPTTTHGYYCSNISGILRGYVRSKDIGRVVSNDSGIVTERDPDTVRGADVAYYSYAVVPKGTPPGKYWPTPELVVEVNSPSDRWTDVKEKVKEYLVVGVRVVCVLDPETESLHIFRPGQEPTLFKLDDELTIPDLLPEFRAKVREFFD